MLADIAFAVGNVILAGALVPTVIKRAPVPPTTSLPTASILTAFAVSFLSLDLWFSGVSAAASAALWWTIYIRNGEA